MAASEVTDPKPAAPDPLALADELERHVAAIRGGNDLYRDDYIAHHFGGFAYRNARQLALGLRVLAVAVCAECRGGDHWRHADDGDPCIALIEDMYCLCPVRVLTDKAGERSATEVERG